MLCAKYFCRKLHGMIVYAWSAFNTFSYSQVWDEQMKGERECFMYCLEIYPNLATT